MFFEQRTFWLPKDLDQPEAYEDAFALDAGRGVAAICDGVGAGIFSGAWARILAENLVARPPSDAAAGWTNWLGQCRQTWRAAIDVENLAWHQKAKLEVGGAATALWLQLTPEAGGYRYDCRAIGDCCLFHVRRGRVLRAFPLDASQNFEAHPAVLFSQIGKPDGAAEIVDLSDDCEEDDLLALATDALAAWAIRALEAGETPEFAEQWFWSDSDWGDFIQRERQSGAMRFDDTTLLLLKIGRARNRQGR